MFQPDVRGRGQRVHLLFVRNVDFPRVFKVLELNVPVLQPELREQRDFDANHGRDLGFPKGFQCFTCVRS